MNKTQTTAYRNWLRANPYAEVVEEPCVMHNVTFGDVAYFTVKIGNGHYVEYGIKPNGGIFKIN